MPGIRTTAGLAIATAVCGLLLWTLERRGASPAPRDAAAALVFPRGFGDVEAVIVERGGLRADLRREDGRWRQVQPFAAEVDQIAVRRLLDALADAPLLERLSLDELRRRELRLQHFGLAPPQARVVVRGSIQRHEIDFGNRTPDGGEVYLYVDAASQVLVAPAAMLDAVPASLDRIRERALLRDTGRAVTALELRRPGLPYLKLARSAGEWQIVQPLAAAADATAVEAALAALRQARIEAFVWPAETNAVEAAGSLRSRLALYGLDAENALQVQFWEAGGPAGVRLRFGRPAEGRPGCVYALTADEQSVVAVSNATAAALQVSPADLRDRRLFAETPERIDRFQLRFADQLIECRRDSGRRWKLVSPLADDADQEEVGRLLVGLLRLRAARLEDEPAGRPPESVWPARPLCVVELGASNHMRRCAVTNDPAAGLCVFAFTGAATRAFVPSAAVPAALLSPAAAFGLRDRTIVALPAAQVRRLGVRRGAETETVARMPGGDAWQVADSPAGKAVAAESLAAWLHLLAGMAANRIERLGAGDLAAYGLDDPWMETSVDLQAADALRKVVLVGRELPDGGRYAMLRGHDAVFVLGPETVRVLGLRLVQNTPPPAAEGTP